MNLKIDLPTLKAFDEFEVAGAKEAALHRRGLSAPLAPESGDSLWSEISGDGLEVV